MTQLTKANCFTRGRTQSTSSISPPSAPKQRTYSLSSLGAVGRDSVQGLTPGSATGLSPRASLGTPPAFDFSPLRTTPRIEPVALTPRAQHDPSACAVLQLDGADVSSVVACDDLVDQIEDHARNLIGVAAINPAACTAAASPTLFTRYLPLELEGGASACYDPFPRSMRTPDGQERQVAEIRIRIPRADMPDATVTIELASPASSPDKIAALQSRLATLQAQVDALATRIAELVGDPDILSDFEGMSLAESIAHLKETIALLSDSRAVSTRRIDELAGKCSALSDAFESVVGGAVSVVGIRLWPPAERESLLAQLAPWISVPENQGWTVRSDAALNPPGSSHEPKRSALKSASELVASTPLLLQLQSYADFTKRDGKTKRSFAYGLPQFPDVVEGKVTARFDPSTRTIVATVPKDGGDGWTVRIELSAKLEVIGMSSTVGMGIEDALKSNAAPVPKEAMDILVKSGILTGPEVPEMPPTPVGDAVPTDSWLQA